MRRFQHNATKRRDERQRKSAMLQRLMENAGVVRLCNTCPVDMQWYRDQRALPAFQAAYLGKLTRLREDLISQEHTNMVNTVTRLQDSNRKPNRNDHLRSRSYETLQERHKRTLAEREKQLESRRKPLQTPRLSPLKGKSVTGTSGGSTPEPRKNGGGENDVMDWDELNELIQEQASRLQPFQPRQDLHPQHSIPNIGPRAVKNPNVPYMSLDARLRPSRSDTFIRQMELHEKDSKGLYRGRKRRQLMHADRDEMDLSPDAFKFDLPDIYHQRSGSTSSGNNGQYHPGCVSPASSDMVYCMEQKHKDNYRFPGYQGPVNRSYPFRRNGLVTNKVLYMQNNQYPSSDQHHSLREVSKPVMLSQPVQQEILTQHRLHIRHQQTLSPEERAAMNCLFCQNPSLSMYSAGQGQYIMAHTPRNSPVTRKNTCGSAQLKRPPHEFRRSWTGPAFDYVITAVHDVNSKYTSREATDIMNNVKVEQTSQLKVDMPSLILNQPTPVPGSREGEINDVSLSNMVKQKELREREVQNLLEDVKELNQQTQHLRQESL